MAKRSDGPSGTTIAISLGAAGALAYLLFGRSAPARGNDAPGSSEPGSSWDPNDPNATETVSASSGFVSPSGQATSTARRRPVSHPEIIMPAVMPSQRDMKRFQRDMRVYAYSLQMPWASRLAPDGKWGRITLAAAVAFKRAIGRSDRMPLRARAAANVMDEARVYAARAAEGVKQPRMLRSADDLSPDVRRDIAVQLLTLNESSLGDFANRARAYGAEDLGDEPAWMVANRLDAAYRQYAGI